MADTSQTRNARGLITGRVEGTLTTQQAEFVRLFANGLQQTEAAKQAGYSSPGTDGWRLMQLPHIKAAISLEIESTITGDGARIAWRTMLRLMSNEETPANVQFQAAKWTLEASGAGLAAQAQRAGLMSADKPLAEMSIGELERFVAESSARLKAITVIDIAADVTQTVERAPVCAPLPSLPLSATAHDAQ